MQVFVLWVLSIIFFLIGSFLLARVNAKYKSDVKLDVIDWVSIPLSLYIMFTTSQVFFAITFKFIGSLFN